MLLKKERGKKSLKCLSARNAYEMKFANCVIYGLELKLQSKINKAGADAAIKLRLKTDKKFAGFFSYTAGDLFYLSFISFLSHRNMLMSPIKQINTICL